MSMPVSANAGSDVVNSNGDFCFRHYTKSEIRKKFNRFKHREQKYVGKKIIETFFHPDRFIRYGRNILLDYFLGNFLNIIERRLWDDATTDGVGENLCRMECIHMFQK